MWRRNLISAHAAGSNYSAQPHPTLSSIPDSTVLAMIRGLPLAGFAVAALTPLPVVVAAQQPDVPATGWVVASHPSVSIGQVEGPSEYLFSSVEAVDLLRGGGVVVANRGSSEVRVYSEQGEFEGAVGRSGEGPGEFMWLSWVAECQLGVLHAYDVRLARVTRIDLAPLQVTKTFTMTAPNLGRGFDAIGCLDGGFFGSSRILGAPPSAPGPVRFEVQLNIFDRVGTPQGGSRMFPGDDRYFFGNSVGPAPLGRQTVFAGIGSHVFVGTQDDEPIRRFGLTAEHSDSIPVPWARRPVTPAIIESYVEGRAQLSSDPAGTRRLAQEYEFPPHLPSYGRMVADDAGILWIEADSSTGATGMWYLLDSSGSWLGSVEVPERFELHSVRGDRLAGVWRDDTDVEFIWILALDRPAAH